MSKKLSQNITYWLGVVAIGLVVGLSLQFVRAWTEPAVAPPGGNIGAPINTSNIGQSKAGNLLLNSSGTWANGLIVANGNVGIGTTGPGAKLHVVGGSAIIDPSGASANAFKVLASNGNTAFSISNTGTAESFVFGSDGSAQASFGIITSANTIKFQTHTVDRMAIDTNGNVGIGTTGPSQKLDVAGYVKGQSGLCIGNDCRTSWPQTTGTGYEIKTQTCASSTCTVYCTSGKEILGGGCSAPIGRLIDTRPQGNNGWYCWGDNSSYTAYAICADMQ